MQIAHDGIVITNAALFEFRSFASRRIVDSRMSGITNWPEAFVSLLVDRLHYLGTQLDLQGSGIDKLLASLVIRLLFRS